MVQPAPPPPRPHLAYTALIIATAAAMFGSRKAQEALDRVLAVAARIDGHEKLCGERWEQLRDSIRGMMAAMEAKHHENRADTAENKAALGRLWWAIIVGMGVTICGMAGLIATLAVRGHIIGG